MFIEAAVIADQFPDRLVLLCRRSGGEVVYRDLEICRYYYDINCALTPLWKLTQRGLPNLFIE